ncbi:alkaline phosphatase family protein [Vagococcus sp. JNUCC 83]
MLKNKVLLIILDGCRYDIAMEQMGFLNSLVEHEKAQVRKMKSEMPSNSRPLYEVIMTGKPMYQNEIYTNLIVRRSKELSIFDLVKSAGGTTGMSGYYWMSELYNQSPYNIFTDRIQHDESKLIQHGIFYSEDHYPDSHVFADANSIITEYQPDFMVIHSMNIDDVGHKFTSDSREYMAQVNIADNILGTIVPTWCELGYKVIVTADHGMDEYGLHGGNLPQHREVPFYFLSDSEILPKKEIMSQLELMPFIADLMDV